MSSDEQRGKRDRRQVNLGPPPGCEERRRNPDRRVARIDELELSEEEWKAYFGDLPEQRAPEGDGTAEPVAGFTGLPGKSEPEGS
jgi:hypothetical protein